jgi:predicted Zn-dependent peptidase
MQVVYRAHPGELTAIALSVRAGARFDGSHPGLAHLAEHMLFQGTTSLDQVALNRRAAELGGEHNADTGYEDIALTFEVFNEDLDAGLGLLADQYYRTQIDAKRFRKERRVVLEEIRGRLDDPADRVYRRAWSRFFDGALAHPVCGSLGSVRAIETAHVTVFLRRQFDHANTVLAIVGGVSLAQARAAVEKHFQGGVSNRPARAPAVRIRGAGHVRLRQSNGSQAYFAKLMPVAHKPRHLLATGVALDLVGADPDSRLFQELRERLGLSYELSSSLEWGPDWAVAIISASAARSRADRLMKAVEETCRRAAREGFEDADVKRARKKIRYRYALLDDNRLDQALALAESVLWGLPTPKEAEQIVCSLTLEEINAAWRRAVAAPCVTALLS